MHIFIDESGSFKATAERGRWSTVGALVVPEQSLRPIEAALTRLKLRLGFTKFDEVKIRDIDETALLHFLQDLGATRALFFCVSTDSGLTTDDAIRAHRTEQAALIRANLPRMLYENGRLYIEGAASLLERVSNQLYAQLVCEIELLHQVTFHVPTYFAKRIPGTLGSFRWRIDQKGIGSNIFDRSLLEFAPVLLQTKSIHDPAPVVDHKSFDYRKFKAFDFVPGTEPRYLQTQHGIPLGPHHDLKRLLADWKFVDSQDVLGIQVVDILVSTANRCFRGNFDRLVEIASQLGSFMLQRSMNRSPAVFVGFHSEDALADPVASRAAIAMRRSARNML